MQIFKTVLHVASKTYCVIYPCTETGHNNLVVRNTYMCLHVPKGYACLFVWGILGISKT